MWAQRTPPVRVSVRRHRLARSMRAMAPAMRWRDGGFRQSARSRFRCHHNDVSRSNFLARAGAWPAASFLFSPAKRVVPLVSTAPSLHQLSSTPRVCVPSARVTLRSGINRLAIGAANTFKFRAVFGPTARHARTAKNLNLLALLLLSDKGKPLRLPLKVLPIISHHICT